MDANINNILKETEEKWEENIKMFSVIFKEDTVKDLSAIFDAIVEIFDFWQKLALLYNKMPMLEAHEKIPRVEENAKLWHNESHLNIRFARIELVDEHVQNVLRLYADFLAQRLQNSLFEGTGALYRLKKFLCPKQMEKFVSFGQLTQKYPQLKEILRRRLNIVEILQLQMVNYISLFDFDTAAPQWKQSQFLLDNLAYYKWFKEHSKNLTKSEQKDMEENYAKMEICMDSANSFTNLEILEEIRLEFLQQMQEIWRINFIGEKTFYFGDYGGSSTDGQKSILKSVFSMHEQSLKPLLLVNSFRQKLKGIYIDTERIGGELHENSAVFSNIKELCLGALYTDVEKKMYNLLKKYFLLLIRTSDEPISEEEKQKFNIETFKANNEIVVADLFKFVSNLNAENERQLIWIVSKASTKLANLGLLVEMGEETTTLNTDEQNELYTLIFDSDEKTSREAETKLAMKQLIEITKEKEENLLKTPKIAEEIRNAKAQTFTMMALSENFCPSKEWPVDRMLCPLGHYVQFLSEKAKNRPKVKWNAPTLCFSCDIDEIIVWQKSIFKDERVAFFKKHLKTATNGIDAGIVRILREKPGAFTKLQHLIDLEPIKDLWDDMEIREKLRNEHYFSNKSRILHNYRRAMAKSSSDTERLSGRLAADITAMANHLSDQFPNEHRFCAASSAAGGANASPVPPFASVHNATLSSLSQLVDFVWIDLRIFYDLCDSFVPLNFIFNYKRLSLYQSKYFSELHKFIQNEIKKRSKNAVKKWNQCQNFVQTISELDWVEEEGETIAQPLELVQQMHFETVKKHLYDEEIGREMREIFLGCPNLLQIGRKEKSVGRNETNGKKNKKRKMQKKKKKEEDKKEQTEEEKEKEDRNEEEKEDKTEQTEKEKDKTEQTEKEKDKTEQIGEEKEEEKKDKKEQTLEEKEDKKEQKEEEKEDKEQTVKEKEDKKEEKEDKKEEENSNLISGKRSGKGSKNEQKMEENAHEKSNSNLNYVLLEQKTLMAFVERHSNFIVINCVAEQKNVYDKLCNFLEGKIRTKLMDKIEMKNINEIEIGVMDTEANKEETLKIVNELVNREFSINFGKVWLFGIEMPANGNEILKEHLRSFDIEMKMEYLQQLSRLSAEMDKMEIINEFQKLGANVFSTVAKKWFLMEIFEDNNWDNDEKATNL
ncbi:hypothetical protein niasHT_027686 [Heterodera trifolii]|uniref:Dynein heavy chain n=1 Tax=Heterodera trifolii TaxID=157864 RepID=A0ABD2KA33_9BILA